jgi:hypothetical protein
MQRLKNYVDTALNSSNVLANANVFVVISGKAAAVALSGALQRQYRISSY